MEQILNELIKFYLDEASYPIIDIPTNYVNKRDFLRGLLNVRDAKPVPAQIIEKEDELLQLELKEKKLTDINSFEDRISLWQGDITSVICDAVVNPTDTTMIGCKKPNHNCVSNKIHSYAGVALRLKCKEITKGQNIEVSKVILTDGYNLPCKYIIHTVKPEIEDELDDNKKEEIRRFYINSLELAKKNNIKTVCIPNLSVPSKYKEEVADIFIKTVREYMNNNNEIDKLLIDIYTLDDYDIYKKYFE